MMDPLSKLWFFLAYLLSQQRATLYLRPKQKGMKMRPAHLNVNDPAHGTTNRLILTVQAPMSLHISSTYGKRSHPQSIFSRAASRDQTAV
jgi:hypothetical protein